MDFVKNQIVTIKIEDIGTNGEGVGRVDGFTLFVKGAVIGDLVEAKIIKVKKHYGYARIEKILEPGKDRVKPVCPVADKCGGCAIQHLSYEKQLEWKFQKVKNCLERIGGLENIEQKMEPIYGMEYPYYYRNKAQFPVGTDKNGRLITGFYAGRTHSIIENTHCYIQAEVNEQILETVLGYCRRNHISAYDEKTGKGVLRHILTRVGFRTGEIMVCLIINANKKKMVKIEGLVEELTKI